MRAQVLALRLPRFPTAVVRLVVSSGIDSVKRESFRARPHIFHEGGEIVAPSVADRDAFTTVEAVAGRRPDVATAFHAAPDRILALLNAVQIAPVLHMSARAGRTLIATAGARVSAQHVLGHLHGLVTTIATAFPERALRSMRSCGPFNYGQLTESVARNVSRCCGRHACNYKASAPIASVFIAEYLSI